MFQTRSSARAAVVAAWLLLLCPRLGARPFHRVMYADDPVLRLPRDLVERGYGAAVWVLPVEGRPPRRPVKKPGVVLHLDPASDADWVRGDHDPQVEFARLARRVSKVFRGVGDLEDKWNEYQFLGRACPDLAPPRMLRGGHFSREPSGPAEARGVAEAVERALAGQPRPSPWLRRRLRALETLRRHIQAELGRAMVKIRRQDHSEGNVPRSDEDWLAIYLRYLRDTKPRVARIEREIQGTTLSLQEKVVYLPDIEGRVMERLLEAPDQVIAQSMIRIAKEVRVHVVEGRILEGASFLRFYPLGQYLTPGEIARVETAVREKLLAGLPEELRGLSLTPDVSIEEETGRLRILDLNAGLYSGYYFPEEDLITTNLLAAHLSGETTPLLVELAALRAAPMGPGKVAAIRGYRGRYARFLEGDVQESFWDRVLASYRELLAEDPSPARYQAALEDLLRAGLRTSSNLLQFAMEVQATWPRLRLPDEAARVWPARLHDMDPEIFVWAEDGRLRFSEERGDRQRALRRARPGHRRVRRELHRSRRR